MKLARRTVEPSATVPDSTDTELTDLRPFEPRMDRLERTPAGGAAPTAELEGLRSVLLATAERLLLPLNEPAFPLTLDRWSQLQTGCSLLRRVRELYLSVDDAAGAKALQDHARHRSTDGPAESLVQVMALMRGLDAQTRLLRFVLRNRVVPAVEEWQELLRLAHRARASTFLDTQLPDPVTVMKVNTARALLILPLLLREARLETLNPVERLLADRLARQLAHRVGFRIDRDGDLHANSHGPTVVIDNEVSVRLDTHALLRTLSDKSARLASGVEYGARLPRGVTAESMRQLLVRLQSAWGPGQLPIRIAPVDATVCSIHLGLPGALDDRAEARVSYDYGRYDVNTIMQLARKQKESGRSDLSWLSRDGQVTVRGWSPAAAVIDARVERTGRTPLALHALVVLRPVDARACAIQVALADEAQFWLGRLVGLAEVQDTSPLAPSRQLLTLQMWPLPGRIVGLRPNTAALFEDVLLVPGLAGSLDEHTVLLRPGHWSPSEPAVLRVKERDLDVRLVNVVERGHQFERVRLVIEGAARP